MSGAEITSAIELDTLRYAERNHGRNFVTALPDEPHNLAIHRLTEAGLFRDGGPSASGRWRVLTEAGREALMASASIHPETRNF